ncbi:PepSY domain-containing protein [Enterovibrio sp. ZSDZ35]|uniref:PepSY domain-containing protein n=1 Tax=Enterovibrio qingdaonensis TaxID=2899818 RepID=A0ABT5QKE1_9GAMM|nr:PepSY domain-containing protein [Enterovibrio sp. ZSDZ35]MDD1781449.1 PepSY domain-containing protein [Enterovibrio sp. ZSDZ35]
MSGDISNPTQDRTMHVDQYSGDELADIGFADYNLLAKSMAAGIALHKGGVSVVNKILNVVFCVVFMVISFIGGIMWWKRRPRGAGRLAAPPSPEGSGFWVVGFITLATICVLFPLAGASVIAIVGIDWLVFRKVPAIKQVIN